MQRVFFFGLLMSISAFVAAQSGGGALEAGFKNPPVSARPKALWPWVNGNFSRTAITRELEEARAKGMGGFDIWDVGTSMNPNGIVPDGPPFLEAESLEGIAHAIREAGRLNLEMGLITSSSWNAGGAWVKPEHGAMGLFRTDTLITGPATIQASLPFPKIPNRYGRHQTMVARGADGLPLYYKDVVTLVHPVRADSTIAEGEIQLTDAGKPVKLGPGRWRMVRYVCAPTGQPLMIPSPLSNGLMLDHFNAEAQRANMEHIIGRLKTKFPDLRNTSLKYLYEDSYEVNSAVWTATLPDFFQTYHGYSIEKFLPVLDGFTVNNDEVAQRFMFDFNKVLSEMIIANHYAAGREIAEKEGLGFYAEAGGPGKPIHNVPFEDLKALGSLTVPRGEFWRKHPTLELLQIVKGIASAAHIYNQPAVEAESFTSVWLWQEGPAELKPLADRAMCEGLNRFVYHTFPHTTEDAGRPGWIYNFGTLINTTNGWWPQSDAFHHYLARCSYLLQQGHFVGDAAIYYGDEAPNFVKPRHVPPTLGKGYDYDVVNSDAILNRMTVKDGKIALPHGQTYEVLVLPDDARINPEVLDKIAQLVGAGATVVGPQPTRAYSLAGATEADKHVAGLASRLWRNGSIRPITAREALQHKKIAPDFEVSSGASHDSIDFIHRRVASTDLYFIRNMSRKTFTGSLSFRAVAASVSWWNPVNAQIFELINAQQAQGRTSVAVQLRGEESAFIVFSSNASGAARVTTAVATATGMQQRDINQTTIPITSPWSLRIVSRDGATVETKLPSLVSVHQLDDAYKYNAGNMGYTTTFNWRRKAGGKVLLSLNIVEEIANVILNGKHVGTHWHASQQFDITPLLKKGDNVLSIDVVTTINNALIGDAKRPPAERVYKTNITKLPNAWMKPFAEAPLLPAGLLGPVTLTVFE